MQDWLEFVVKGLVDHPEQVRVTPVPQNGLTLFELRVHADDAGKVIGRKGATINALRALLQVGSARRGERMTVDLVEDDDVTEAG
ncbi:MAG: KH domain-containing protein [Verrucomicrobiae bacterium]|nr:KH domain-containing protein [Verrucomicrobiae bacterium]MCP5524670.1 KH domain-containing protein [Verrucomicrobiales bacterium]